jgi:23S rRNA (adenine2030-N6)-methyltransferase
MNYRHIYHAGNFADAIKHTVLLACLNYLQKKEAPLFVLDTHAGAGLYDLTSEEARKTGEWEGGVGRIASRPDGPLPDVLQGYVGSVSDDLKRGLYQGSPLLIARMLRPEDRLIASELHIPSFNSLEAALRPFKNAKALNMDGYRCARASLPPKERRGLVLVDPPFEKKDEFATLIRQMREWKKRWATGVYLLWYPIKAHLPVSELKESAAELAIPRTVALEILLHPRLQPETLNGCGLLLLNAPYTVPETLLGLLPALRSILQLHHASLYSVTT